MDEGLRSELLRRSAADQEARLKLQGFLGQGAGPLPEEAQPDLEQLQRLDQANTAWLKGIVRERGWPGRSLAGDDGATAAWLLVQHADHDPAFQRECLDLMTKAVERGDASAAYWAYLTDRVLRAERRPQRYGTQFTIGPQGLQPQSLEDPEGVDERRASVGLGPLDDYRRQMAEQYGGPAAQPDEVADPKSATEVPYLSCRSGSLEVEVRAVRIPGGLGALSRLPGFRPKPRPIGHDVALPWLPDGCVPCRYGPGLGATRDAEAVVNWYEPPQPPSQPVEINWMEMEGGSFAAEPTMAGDRTAIWVSGSQGAYQAVVVLTEEGRRYVVTGVLTRDELLHVAGTLPA